MLSYFWSGYVLQNFIFYNFNTKTVPGFLGVFIALFSVGILYEALFYLKKDLLHKFLLLQHTSSSLHRRSSPLFEALQRSESDDTTATTVVVTPDDGAAGDTNNPRNSLLADDHPIPSILPGGAHPPRISVPTWMTHSGISHPETIYLLVASTLHAVYVFIGFTLMNAVMTFNVWVMAAVCGGIGVGYLFFRTESFSDGHLKRSSRNGPPFRNTIETDEEPDYASERDPLQNKTENPSQQQQQQFLQSPSKKSPSSPSGSRTSGGSGRRSRNRERAAAAPADAKIDAEESPEKGDQSEEDVPAAGQVIVVGAQVHNTYQQSV